MFSQTPPLGEFDLIQHFFKAGSDAMLSEGEITDNKIECWLHGAEFDLRTGAALTPPAVAPLETFSVTRNGDVVTISQKTEESGK